MKHFTVLLLLVLGWMLSSSQANSDTKLYPKIESYFSSLDLSGKHEVNTKTLHYLKDNIELSEIDEKHTYLLKGTNNDAVAFAQIIIQTWLKEKKFKKVDFLSCATVPTISDAGMETLKEIGYDVKYADGIYTIKFSDDQKPLKLTFRSCSDKKLEQSKIMNLVFLPLGEKDAGSDVPFYYIQGNAKETFRSLAVDLFSILKELKK